MASISVEYCAFTVAIVLVCHHYTGDRSDQYSSLALAQEMRQSKYGREPHLAVDAIALHQGFGLFKRTLEKKGVNYIKKNGNVKGLMLRAPFMDLPGIYGAAEALLSPAAEALLSPADTEVAQPLIKRRKKGEALGPQQLETLGKMIVATVGEQYCIGGESPGIFIEAAHRLSSNGKDPNRFQSSSKQILIDPEDEILERLKGNALIDGFLHLFPRNYIVFSDEQINVGKKINL